MTARAWRELADTAYQIIADYAREQAGADRDGAAEAWLRSYNAAQIIDTIPDARGVLLPPGAEASFCRHCRQVIIRQEDSWAVARSDEAWTYPPRYCPAVAKSRGDAADPLMLSAHEPEPAAPGLELQAEPAPVPHVTRCRRTVADVGTATAEAGPGQQVTILHGGRTRITAIADEAIPAGARVSAARPEDYGIITRLIKTEVAR